MPWKNFIFQMIFIAIIFLVVYTLLKKYVFVKFHPNKIVLLVLAVIAFFVPSIANAFLKKSVNNSILQYVGSAIFIILFLWFLDIQNGSMNKKGKRNDIKIRPKAKPNRARNNKK
ncbi:hypothetical protein GTH52_08680 [Clostridium tyrobutyricum]|jgi:glucan phosphoethanolaminetransferase (alkaline phosphatase superfamily)|uniref:Uncharacterized protein n=1 Tax=Clostridium tyrobutyricum DIVETGP TaxID=1408889 RepID=W6N3V7_CLOTY|nr:hypothetical protein [Clostridium tyrobutyricum]AND83942.1 hypothetical protein CTK_C06810 [Clostridium tyrobutyricum]ANP68682.1 hypothetical protein BA182_03050 [Clostridium tyrobutyricum]MBR9647103.1 hypothetical protein [Clostridium tyrobutyricum]MBV4423201.1 hypothetical protein [Clostridium tyrobutyricum]MBV4426295.1 hypothetical protein [Clostridium tyrobutyricum]